MFAPKVTAPHLDSTRSCRSAGVGERQESPRSGHSSQSMIGRSGKGRERVSAAVWITVRWAFGVVGGIFLPIAIIAVTVFIVRPARPTCVPSVRITSIDSLRGLPSELRQVMTANLPDIVDRRKPFQAGDVGIGPMRRFVIGGRINSRWVLAYEQGGLGYHIRVVAFDWPNQSEKPAMISNRFSSWETFCGEFDARLRNEPIPTDQANAEDWRL
jgi:hypothetical protein